MSHSNTNEMDKSFVQNCTVDYYYHWEPAQWTFPRYEWDPYEPVKKFTVTTPSLALPTFPQPLSKYPDTHITVKKSRLKEHKTRQTRNLVYLDHEAEFEIELFNGSNETLGVKIKLNGKYISDRHMVIYPGQRVFLDRYIDDARKFKFHKYVVSGAELAEVAKAIEDNGKITVEYYREYVRSEPTLRVTQTTLPEEVWINHSNLQDTVTCCLDSVAPTPHGNFWETGIIEKGGMSNTRFDEIDKNFDSFVEHTKHFQLLPSSQKPIETKDLVRYCTQCSGKLKKEHRYCANCGTKVE
jgi:hypothetical protein